MFGFTLSCHFRVMKAQTEHNTKVIASNWIGQRALCVWSMEALICPIQSSWRSTKLKLSSSTAFSYIEPQLVKQWSFLFPAVVWAWFGKVSGLTWSATPCHLASPPAVVIQTSVNDSVWTTSCGSRRIAHQQWAATYTGHLISPVSLCVCFQRRRLCNKNVRRALEDFLFPPLLLQWFTGSIFPPPSCKST